MNSWLVGTGAIYQAAQSAFSSQHDTQTGTYILPCGLHDWSRHKNDSHSLDKEESTIATAAAVLMEAKKFPRRAVSSVGTSRVSMHVTIYSDSTGVGHTTDSRNKYSISIVQDSPWILSNLVTIPPAELRCFLSVNPPGMNQIQTKH